MKAAIATVLYALLVATVVRGASGITTSVIQAPLAAQTTTPIQRQIKVARDSILCTGSASQRQQRACKRLDSLIVNPPSVVVSAHYQSGVYGAAAPNADTVTVCGKLHFPDHSERIIWPAVRIRIIGDSAVMGLRGGNPLWQMCFQGAVTPKDSVVAMWSLEWQTLDGRRRLLPVFRLP